MCLMLVTAYIVVCLLIEDLKNEKTRQEIKLFFNKNKLRLSHKLQPTK